MIGAIVAGVMSPYISQIPLAPTIGTATAGGASATVTFTPAATGPTATSFTATSSPGGITGTASSSPITVSGLTNGTSYTFTVTASNAYGTSAASAASNAVVPAFTQFFFTAASGTAGQYSGDGITWTSTTMPASTGWYQSAKGAGIWVVKSTSATTTYATSPDLATWTSRTSNQSSTGNIAFGNSVFASATQTGTGAESSTNGTSWTTRSMGNFTRYGNMIYGDKFAIVTYNGDGCQTSSDAITWTKRAMPATDYWTAIHYFGSTYIAYVDGVGSAATSSDAITWTTRSNLVSSGNPREMASNGSSYVMVVVNSVNYVYRATSITGTFSTQTIPYTGQHSAIAYGNGVYAICSRSTQAATSTDGVTWTQRTNSSAASWDWLTYA